MTSRMPLSRTAQTVHAAGDGLQCVDVEARVGFVEDGELRLQHRHLQDFVALLLAAGEAFVDAALQKLLIHAATLAASLMKSTNSRAVLFRSPCVARGVRPSRNSMLRNAGNFDWILKRQEHAVARALRRSARSGPAEVRRSEPCVTT